MKAAPYNRMAWAGPHVSGSMGSSALLLVAALLTADPTPPSTAGPPAEREGDVVPDDGKSGAGVAPVELIPRLEPRQSFARAPGGGSVHITTAEIDLTLTNRVLLRYEGPLRVASGPAGQVSGFGDALLRAFILLTSSPRFIAVAIAGVEMNTASQPQLGSGKQQLLLGGA